MRAKKRDHVDVAIAAGAFVLPPKPQPAATPIEPEQPDVEDLAEVLETAWSTGTSDDTKPDTTPSDRRAEDLIGQTVDGVVISWNPGWFGWPGFIRLKKYGKSRGSLYFKQEDIVTIGSVKVGSEVRFLVADSDGKSLEDHDVEIYQ